MGLLSCGWIRLNYNTYQPHGAVVQKYEYDSSGNMSLKPHFIKQPYTYTAREFDPETGLYYYRARYYDAKVGRFISRDPIGFGGGINVYIYVSNNSVNYRDPKGLDLLGCAGAMLMGKKQCNENLGNALDMVGNYIDKCEQDCQWCHKQKLFGKCPSEEEKRKHNCEKYEHLSYEHCSLARIGCAQNLPSDITSNLKTYGAECALAIASIVKNCSSAFTYPKM
ncbi:MAG TPA: RHS repeat-associated core domain-containing protein [Caldithrix sp.]|nr:RHS repeat-associated core domain-containing protein [Caldithrix sp.]